jgi:hypothetical protein
MSHDLENGYKEQCLFCSIRRGINAKYLEYNNSSIDFVFLIKYYGRVVYIGNGDRQKSQFIKGRL